MALPDIKKTVQRVTQIFQSEKKLRITACCLLLVAAFSLFLPFAGVASEISITGAKGNKLEFLSPEQPVTEFSGWDLLSRKDLREYKLFGTEIGSYDLFGVNIYDLLLNGLPDYGVLQVADEFFNSDLTNLLTDEKIRNFCTEHLGQFGTALVPFMDTLSSMVDETKDLVETASEIVDSLRQTFGSVRTGMQQLLTGKAIMETAFTALCLLLPLGICLLLVKKLSAKPAAIIITILFSVFVLFGVALLVINAIVNGSLSSFTYGARQFLDTLLSEYAPNLKGIFYFLGWDGSGVLTLNVYAYCGAGYYIGLVALGLSAMFSFLSYKKERQLSAKQPAQKDHIL